MLALALATGFGIFMVVTALGPRPVRVRLLEEDRRPFLERMLESFFAPAAQRVVTSIGRMTAEDFQTAKEGLERRLAQADYPPPFVDAESVFARRLFTAVLFAVFGGAFAAVVGMGGMTLLLMAGLAAFGWFLPDKIIASARQERVEQLTLDAASTLDRLAIYVAAGHALPVAVRSLAERPGGAWVGEFRKVASEYAVTGDFQHSLSKIVEDSGGLPEIARVSERLRAAYGMGGGGVADALRRMAADARVSIRLLITERGYKNAVLMVIPAFLSITAATIVLVGPGAVRMINVLAGP